MKNQSNDESHFYIIGRLFLDKMATKIKRQPKRLRTVSKNKKKTLTKKVQNRDGKYFSFKVQGKIMKKENDDSTRDMKDEEKRSKSIEKLEDAFTETTEEIKSKLNELITAIKNFNSRANVMLKIRLQLKKCLKEILSKKLSDDICNKSCKCSEENHFKEYQKIICDQSHFRPGKNFVIVNAIRSNRYITVIQWCMVEEIRRLISLNQADIDSNHPILIRLARDGFFSNDSGLVSCFFCGSMIHNYLFLSRHHDRLINLLDNHCNRCDRRNNITVENYGSHVNLAALMGWMNQRLHDTVPSGYRYQEKGRRGFCQVARWINDYYGSIVPSGMRHLQEPQVSLPQPNICLVTPVLQPQNNVQAVPNTPAVPAQAAPNFPQVLDAYVLSNEGQRTVRDGYTHAQIYAAVERLIVSRERVTYANIIAKLRDMKESPGA